LAGNLAGHPDASIGVGEAYREDWWLLLSREGATIKKVVVHAACTAGAEQARGRTQHQKDPVSDFISKIKPEFRAGRGAGRPMALRPVMVSDEINDQHTSVRLSVSILPTKTKVWSSIAWTRRRLFRRPALLLERILTAGSFFLSRQRRSDVFLAHTVRTVRFTHQSIFAILQHHKDPKREDLCRCPYYVLLLRSY